MCIITVIVGEQAKQPLFANWLFTGKPFLIGTVALGGATNIVPVVFAKVRMEKQG